MNKRLAAALCALFFANHIVISIENAFAEPAAQPASSQPNYAQALKSGNAEQRRIAINALAGVKDRKDIPVMLGALKDSDILVRQIAVRCLGIMRAQEALDPAIALLGDPSEEVRREALLSLGYLNHPNSTPHIAKLLRDPKDMIRMQAAITLGMMTDPAVVAPLVSALSDTNSNVVQTAAQSLGNVDYSRSTAAVSGVCAGLAKLFKSGVPSVQAAAARSVGQIMGRIPPKQRDQTIIVELKKLLASLDALVQVQAAYALANMDINEGYAIALKLLGDKSQFVRAASCETLGIIGNTLAAPSLRRLLKDPQRYVQTAAETALVRMRVPVRVSAGSAAPAQAKPAPAAGKKRP